MVRTIIQGTSLMHDVIECRNKMDDRRLKEGKRNRIMDACRKERTKLTDDV